MTTDATESQRLEALRSYQILDTDPEAVFDDLAYLASQVCHTPIALVSLVDQHRQWFKSKFGTQLSETPRNQSFCAHTLAEKQFLEVPDATKDERFCDNPLVCADPEIRFYAGAPLVSTDGHCLGTLCVIDTEPKQLETHQRDALQRLARIVMQHIEQRLINEKLEEKQAELEFLNEKKSELLGIMAHDIRGSLAGVIGFGNILMDDARKVHQLEGGQRVDFLEEILKCSENALCILNEFLESESLEGGALDTSIKDTPVVDIMDQLKARTGGYARRKQIQLEFHYQPDATAYVDPRLFIELIDNLVNNAIKYSEPGKKVTVSYKKNHEAYATFHVRDEGPGFTEADKKKVFGRFQRLSAQPTGGEHSSGLGLSIVKRLVELHRGHIDLISEVGMGSEFVVTLPVPVNKSAELQASS